LRTQQPGGADKPQELPKSNERAELMSFGGRLHPLGDDGLCSIIRSKIKDPP
jgi:hypothetical protein